MELRAETAMTMFRTCIVCGSEASVKSIWPLSELKPAYEAKVGSRFPANSNCPDYELLRCHGCGLVFADPCRPGDSVFYAWVTSKEDYYSDFRWEWGKTADLIRAESATSLLDIGCGTGNFLSFIKKSCGINVFGLDTLEASVTACRENGHDAACMTLEEYVGADGSTKFDLVTAFHCLEHVADPVGLVKSMAEAVKPGGCIVVSVPYSPPAWEVLEVAPLNRPPHHLTQWNAGAINALGRATGFATKITTDAAPPSSSLAKAIYWLFRATVGLRVDAGSIRAAALLCLHPVIFAKCVNFYVSRDRVDGRLAGDTAFAVFRKPAP